MEQLSDASQATLEQLEKILTSETFQGAARSQTLLRFIVEQATGNRADRLKEYTLGAEALGRGERSIRASIRSSGRKPRG